jgi:pimeloyl-ACP methyl ester carboxylesterase
MRSTSSPPPPAPSQRAGLARRRWRWVALLLLLAVFSAPTLMTLREARQATAQVPPQGRFVEIEDQRWHLLDQGRGPAVLMIHGLGGNALNFAALAERLQRDHRVIRVDRPGSGYSARIADRPADLRAQIDALLALMDDLALERPLVVGHSLGGALALGMALQAPQRLRGLVLLAPATLPFEPQPPLDGLVIAPPLRTLLAWTLAVPLSGLRSDALVEALFTPESPPADFAHRYGALLSRRPSQVRANFEDFAALQAHLRAQAPRYPRLAVPTTVMVGGGDRILDPQLHGAPFRGHEQVQLIEIQEAGHMLPITRVAEIEAVIRARTDAGT